MAFNITMILHDLKTELGSASKKVSDFLNGGILPATTGRHGDHGTKTKTLIVAHRGACGYIPEHSLAAYELAIALGTDYVEPDAVVTKDGQLVALHDLLLDSTTNVAELPQFGGRRTTKMVDGQNMTGFFVDDFTLAELHSAVRLRQRLADTRTTLFDGLFTIPTLPQVFQLAQNATIKYERQIGVYLELKHPQYYAANGVNIEDLALVALRVGGYETKGVVANLMGKAEAAPVVIQCFDPRTLVSLRTKCDLPLVQLVPEASAASLWTTVNLDAVQSYANAVGPPLSLFTAAGVDYARGAAMMAQAAERNLAVHPWQLQAEKKYVSARFGGSTMKESLYFVCCLETQVRASAVIGTSAVISLNTHLPHHAQAIFTEFPDVTKLAIEAAHNDAKICQSLCPSKFPNATLIHKEWAREIAKDCAMPEKVGLLVAAVVILGTLVIILGAAACCTSEFMKTRRQLAELLEEGRKRRERNNQYEMVNLDDGAEPTRGRGGGGQVVSAEDD